MRRLALLVALAVSIAAEPAFPEDGSAVPQTLRPTEPELTSNSDTGDADANPPVVRTKVPVYVPRDRGRPRVIRASGTRGEPGAARLRALAPEHVGRTAVEQPTLWWYVAKPETSPVRVRVEDSESGEVILDKELPAIGGGGFQRLRLSDTRVRLRPDRDYEWSVALVDVRGPGDTAMSVALIRWSRPSKGLEIQLAAAAEAERVGLYAANGYWYDALDAISLRIEAAPAEVGFLEQRAALLEQLGLGSASEPGR